MNIEQIAYEQASGEMLDYFSKEQLAAFLHRCLSKLAEQDVEPIAFAFKHSLLGVLYDFSETEHSNGMVRLYTEAQLLAAQLRTAEACAELMESQHTWITREAASALIRNGDWREYL